MVNEAASMYIPIAKLLDTLKACFAYKCEREDPYLEWLILDIWAWLVCENQISLIRVDQSTCQGAPKVNCAMRAELIISLLLVYLLDVTSLALTKLKFRARR
jgi:hypothetical protein